MADPQPSDVVESSALHPADLADRLQRLPVEEARRILQQLPEGKRADVIAELDRAEATELLQAFSSAELADVLEGMPHSEAADVAGELPPEQRAAVLAELPAQDSAQVASLLRYPADTAGGIMSDRFITLRADQTVTECQELLRQRAADAPAEMTDDIAYLYVTDQDGRLLGVVPFRDLVFRRPHRRMDEIMRTEVKFVRAQDDQEKVARLFQQYHYLALPVLNREDRLVGIVLANQVIDVLKDEVTEDMQRMVGLSGEESALTPWRRSLRGRLGWLYVNLATAFLAASVVSLFESTIARWTALAVFLPIVAGQGGNAGAQTLTVIIRAMALGELKPADGRRALAKELTLGLLNGMAIGLVVGVLGYWWKGSALLGVVVGVAMLLNMLAAALSGVLVPYGLKALRIDPALASSIFVTTVTDVAGFFFFLGLAALGLKLFGG